MAARPGMGCGLGCGWALLPDTRQSIQHAPPLNYAKNVWNSNKFSVCCSLGFCVQGHPRRARGQSAAAWDCVRTRTRTCCEARAHSPAASPPLNRSGAHPTHHPRPNTTPAVNVAYGCTRLYTLSQSTTHSRGQHILPWPCPWGAAAAAEAQRDFASETAATSLARRSDSCPITGSCCWGSSVGLAELTSRMRSPGGAARGRKAAVGRWWCTGRQLVADKLGGDRVGGAMRCNEGHGLVSGCAACRAHNCKCLLLPCLGRRRGVAAPGRQAGRLGSSCRGKCLRVTCTVCTWLHATSAR